jgi:hypothetical protein
MTSALQIKSSTSVDTIRGHYKALIAVFSAVVVARPPDPLAVHLTGVPFANDKPIRPRFSVPWVLRRRPVRRGAIGRKRGRLGKWRRLRERGSAAHTHLGRPGRCGGPHAGHQEEEHYRDHPDRYHTPPLFAERPAVEPLPACEMDDVLHPNTFFLGATASTTVSRPAGGFGTGCTSRARRLPRLTQSSTLSPGCIPKRLRRALGMVNCPLLLTVTIVTLMGIIIARWP